MRSVIALLVLLTGCATHLPREQASELLAQLAQRYKTLDVQGLAALYAEGEDPMADDLRRFNQVDQAKFVLDGLRQTEDGLLALGWLRLYAIQRNGIRLQIQSRHELRIARDDMGQWKILQHRIVDRLQTRGRDVQFVERTQAVGLAAVHRPHTPIGEGTPIIPGNFSGAGASAGDIDGDGDLDLVVGDGQRCRLYRNEGTGRFTEISNEAWKKNIAKVRGAYFFDYDDDGRLDILFTRVELPLVLLRNIDGKRFEDVSHAVAAAPIGQCESAAFADLDGDGDLDIYLVYYGDFEKGGWAYPIYQSTDGEPSAVLRNDRGSFALLQNKTLTPPGWGLAVSIADYDEDGDPDIYLVNDFGNNHLLRNDGGWKFTDVSEQAGVKDQGLGMSSAFGDYDGDGRLDIYVANMFSSARWVFEGDDFPLPLIADLMRQRDLVKQEMRKVTRGNSLYHNEGNGTFKQVAANLGVERADWSWGANFLDYDNDGDLDIYSPNGFITGPSAPDQ